MDVDAAKANLHNYLKHEREAVLAKLEGLSEYGRATPAHRYRNQPARPRQAPGDLGGTGARRHGRVAWWGDAEVPLFNILVHLLAETSRHAGHADILREEIEAAARAVG